MSAHITRMARARFNHGAALPGALCDLISNGIVIVSPALTPATDSVKSRFRTYAGLCNKKSNTRRPPKTSAKRAAKTGPTPLINCKSVFKKSATSLLIPIKLPKL